MFFIVINSGKTVEPLGGVEVIYHTIRPAFITAEKSFYKNCSCRFKAGSLSSESDDFL